MAASCGAGRDQPTKDHRRVFLRLRPPARHRHSRRTEEPQERIKPADARPLAADRREARAIDAVPPRYYTSATVIRSRPHAPP
jgi:hypothetical protein